MPKERFCTRYERETHLFDSRGKDTFRFACGKWKKSRAIKATGTDTAADEFGRERNGELNILISVEETGYPLSSFLDVCLVARLPGNNNNGCNGKTQIHKMLLWQRTHQTILLLLLQLLFLSVFRVMFCRLSPSS